MNAYAKSSDRLRIALQKSGRLADESLGMLSRCGMKFSRSKDKLFCFGENMPVDLLLVRDDDIPNLMADGVCDLGIVGENVAREYALGTEGTSQFESIAPLGFGSCRLSIAIPEADDFASASALEGKRIATTYPNLVREFLETRKVSAQIVRLSGSVEIAPALGTADAIADLVSTGSTLRANHLREVEVILRSEAHLFRTRNAFTSAKQDIFDRLLARVEGVLQVKESKYVMLHAPKAALSAIREILPGAEAPTILPLEGDSSRVAIHAVCRETVFWEHLEDLKKAGASAVLVLPVEKMLA